MNIFVAVLAGFLSFVSPCVFPLVPAYLGYMTGAAVPKGIVQASRWHVLLHAVAFVLGFSVVFTLLGFTAGAFSYWMAEQRLLLERIAGVVLIIFGLHTLGIFEIPLLNAEKKLELRPDPRLGYLRSFIIGLGFAIGWTPCVTVFLGLIYTMALNGDGAAAAPLFLAYSFGLGIPFILVALTLGQASKWLRKLTSRSVDLRVAGRTLVSDLNLVSLISGLLLVLMGVLVFSDALTYFNRFIPQWALQF